MKNSIVMLTFFCFCVEILFLGKFGPKKLEIVSLSSSLILRLIWICRTQWWCSLYLFLTRGDLFLWKFVSKNWNCWSLETRLIRHLEPRLIRIYRFQWWFLFFYFLGWKYPFWIKMVWRFKTVSLGWYTVPRLF